MNRFVQLKILVTSLEEYFQKSYEKGNAAAGIRLRAGMQEIKKLSQKIRIEVSVEEILLHLKNSIQERKKK